MLLAVSICAAVSPTRLLAVSSGGIRVSVWLEFWKPIDGLSDIVDAMMCALLCSVAKSVSNFLNSGGGGSLGLAGNNAFVSPKMLLWFGVSTGLGKIPFWASRILWISVSVNSMVLIKPGAVTFISGSYICFVGTGGVISGKSASSSHLESESSNIWSLLCDGIDQYACPFPKILNSLLSKRGLL